MLRNDGKFKIYVIQHKWDSNSEWTDSAYGEPEINSKTDQFNACGRCWQETGVNGVYDIRNARAGLKIARENVVKDVQKGELSKLIKLRIALVEIEQKTTPIK